jgi:signal transduction histidine kinase
MNAERQRAWLSWGFAALLLLLCGFLAFVQNRWINELGNAERARLKQELTTGLDRLSRDFNNELESAVSGLMPSMARIADEGREAAYESQYARWKSTHPAIFSRIALAVPSDDGIDLEMLQLDAGKLAPAEWPANWTALRNRLTMRQGGGGRFGFHTEETGLIEIPRFGGGPEMGPPPQFREEHRGERRGPRREQEWVLLELNLDYVRTQMLPELLRTHLGTNGSVEYQAEVVLRDRPSQVIFRSTPNLSEEILRAPDVSATLFDVDPSFLRRRPGGAGPGPPGGGGPGRPGRWLMVVRHREGSLEAVVARARWQNYATSAGLLLLILATVGTMVRSSRRAEQLARLQMDFVAGVSHELRTPLTVIRTAAYNLRGTLATKPEQVERYGKLIQDESDKLGGLVEQVLRFASSSAGHAIREREPVALENVIADAIRSSRAASAGIDVETKLDAGLPLILADSQALKHAIQNLLDNAVKYGTEGNDWIGVGATAVPDGKHGAVEIRVADRGPGIPPEEQSHVFDAFFRGQRAIRDQVHGTGLGLNLVKKIVEAHGGSIRVESQPMQGAAFILRIPAAPPELQDEFAHSLS